MTGDWWIVTSNPSLKIRRHWPTQEKCPNRACMHAGFLIGDQWRVLPLGYTVSYCEVQYIHHKNAPSSIDNRKSNSPSDRGDQPYSFLSTVMLTDRRSWLNILVVTLPDIQYSMTCLKPPSRLVGLLGQVIPYVGSL